VHTRLDFEDDEMKSPIFQEEMKDLVKLDTWPEPPSLLPNPLWWACCKWLYALDPADRNDSYKIYVKGKIWMLLVPVSLWVPWGVSGLAWLVYFSCAMSVQDEYLLFSYLARFKVFALVMYGVLPILCDWFRFYLSLTGGTVTIGADGDVSISVNAGGIRSDGLSLMADRCFITSHFLFYLVIAKYKWVRRQHFSGALPRVVWTGDKDSGDKEINAVILWDVCTTVIITLSLTLDLTYRVAAKYETAHSGGYFGQLGRLLLLGASDAARQEEVFYLEVYMVEMYTTMLGLFALPWLLLAIPGLGDMIHQMRPTGFDEAGGVKLRMTLQQMKRKQKRLAVAGLLSEQEETLLNTHLADKEQSLLSQAKSILPKKRLPSMKLSRKGNTHGKKSPGAAV